MSGSYLQFARLLLLELVVGCCACGYLGIEQEEEFDSAGWAGGDNDDERSLGVAIGGHGGAQREETHRDDTDPNKGAPDAERRRRRRDSFSKD